MYLESMPDDTSMEMGVEIGFLLGEYPQLEILGCYKPNKANPYIIVKCHKCLEDAELFPSGLFTSPFQSIRNGGLPCACGLKFRWNEWQWKILLNRVSEPKGYKFLGWAGDYKGATTICRMFCSVHGEWKSARLSNLVLLGRNCPRCSGEAKSEKARQRLENNPKITAQTFHDTGKFHPDTIFTRLGKIRPTNNQSYWQVDCPVCGVTGISQHTHLLIGGKCCGCNNLENQTQGYINIVLEDDIPIAIKFGISSNYEDRLRRQNLGSIHKIVNHSVYCFEDSTSCRSAERFCINTMDCGIISKSEMADGYTETTYCYNIEHIIQVFTDFGATRL